MYGSISSAYKYHMTIFKIRHRNSLNKHKIQCKQHVVRFSVKCKIIKQNIGLLGKQRLPGTTGRAPKLQFTVI